MLVCGMCCPHKLSSYSFHLKKNKRKKISIVSINKCQQQLFKFSYIQSDDTLKVMLKNDQKKNVFLISDTTFTFLL